MREIYIAPEVIPRLPVFGWGTLARNDQTPRSALLDAPNIRFTTSGRAAIALALRVLGIGYGDRVLVPTYHCPTMIAPATHAGAQPLFYSIREDGAPSLDCLERLDLSRVKGLLAAHYFGVPQPLAGLRTFCDRNGIALIEDCAHALFGESDGRPVCSWGDVAVASLTKFFAVPEGGILVSTRLPLDGLHLPERDLTTEVRALIDILETSARYERLPGLNTILAALVRLKRLVRGTRPEAARTIALDEDSVIDTAGAEASFDAATASMSPARVSRWLVRNVSSARLVSRRRRNYTMLASRLAGIESSRVLWPEFPPTAVPYVFPLWVEDPDRRYFGLKAAGFPVFRWDQLWPGTPRDHADHGWRWAKHIFQLPCHQDLTDADIEWMVTTLKKVFHETPARRGRVREAEAVAARTP